MRIEVKREREIITWRDQDCAEIKKAVINYFKETNIGLFQGYGLVEEAGEYEEHLNGYYSGGAWIQPFGPSREETILYFPFINHEVNTITFSILRGSYGYNHEFLGIRHWNNTRLDDNAHISIRRRYYPLGLKGEEFTPEAEYTGGEVGTIERKKTLFRNKKRAGEITSNAFLAIQKMLKATEGIDTFAPKFLSIIERARNGLNGLNDDTPVGLIRTYVFNYGPATAANFRPFTPDSGDIKFYEESQRWKIAAQRARVIFDSFERGEKYVLGRAIDAVYWSDRKGAHQYSTGRFDTLGDLRRATIADFLDGFKNIKRGDSDYWTNKKLELEHPHQIFAEFLYKILH